MLIYPWKNGVVVDTGLAKIAVDTPKPVPGATHVVTHAHYDHTGAARKTTVLTTPGTHEILKVLGGLSSEPVREGSIHFFGDTELSFAPAGHIPGSAQLILDNGKRVVITGDWKLESDILEPGAEIIDDVDVLVLETTFGAPQYQFPDRKEIYGEMKRWVLANLGINNHVVLFGYAVGKSQELTALLNSWGIVPVVPDRTHRVNRLFGLSDVLIGSEGWREYVSEPRVFVLPPNFSDILSALEVELGRKIVARSCSGWARNGFQLSSHADFWQTINLVRKTEPELVLTYGGNAGQVATVLRRMGYDARPLTHTVMI
ncbi:MAG: putative mRNA 3-end processing factor [Candidatus Diapherotrites archaeon]|nr:putative mRNA 3-end processing factor [Candidatus Diapherotrites archaeon]MDN5367035.1 putative mRNA 3-end processing factor [Candidatus Diapherotrites archaeon]